MIVHVGGHNRGALTAFNKDTGAVVWRWAGDGPAYASPIVATLGGTRQIVTISQQNVVGLAADTGALLWQHPFKTTYDNNSTTPIPFGDTILVSAQEKGVTALRPVKRNGTWDAEVAWETREAGLFMSNAVLVDDTLYGLSHLSAGQFFALDAEDRQGAVEDARPRGGEHRHRQGGHVLFLLNDDGELIVARPSRTAFEPVQALHRRQERHLGAAGGSGNRIFVKDVSSLALWTRVLPELRRKPECRSLHRHRPANHDNAQLAEVVDEGPEQLKTTDPGSAMRTLYSKGSPGQGNLGAEPGQVHAQGVEHVYDGDSARSRGNQRLGDVWRMTTYLIAHITVKDPNGRHMLTRSARPCGPLAERSFLGRQRGGAGWRTPSQGGRRPVIPRPERDPALARFAGLPVACFDSAQSRRCGSYQLPCVRSLVPAVLLGLLSEATVVFSDIAQERQGDRFPDFFFQLAGAIAGRPASRQCNGKNLERVKKGSMMNWYLEVLKKYTVFTGRSRRKEYWMFVLVNLVVVVALNVLHLSWLGILYNLAVLVPSIAVGIRRLHDTDRIGWWLLAAFVPVIGWLVLLWFMIQDGDAGESRWVQPQGRHSIGVRTSPRAIPDRMGMIRHRWERRHEHTLHSGLRNYSSGVGWWLGDYVGLMTAYVLSGVGSLAGVYVGWRINRDYLSLRRGG